MQLVLPQLRAKMMINRQSILIMSIISEIIGPGGLVELVISKFFPHVNQLMINPQLILTSMSLITPVL